VCTSKASKLSAWEVEEVGEDVEEPPQLHRRHDEGLDEIVHFARFLVEDRREDLAANAQCVSICTSVLVKQVTRRVRALCAIFRRGLPRGPRCKRPLSLSRFVNLELVKQVKWVLN
jgi:hypothetical protein